MKKHVVFKQFVEKLKPHTKLHVVKEYRGDGFKYSVRDFVAGMMGNSSWCYGRFMTANDALVVFPDAKYSSKGA